MTTENALLITFGSKLDAHAMFKTLKMLVDTLTENSAVQGDVTLLGGIGIRDTEVAEAIDKLVALFTDRAADAEAKEAASNNVRKVIDNVIHGNFSGEIEDGVLRDLPDLMPTPETLQ